MPRPDLTLTEVFLITYLSHIFHYGREMYIDQMSYIYSVKVQNIEKAYDQRSMINDQSCMLCNMGDKIPHKIISHIIIPFLDKFWT